jgi:hypothetical protein
MPPKSPHAESSEAMNAFSRTVAAGLLMLAFMAGGYYLDQWLETKIFIVLGIIVGMACSITVMLIHSKISDYENSIKDVKPLSDEDEEASEDKDDR